ncbi:alpha/beta fold hydrolase [Streptomyces sp. NPDC051976]|uniref:alpha/beta fold hydrolase n=1 Tax=Streptomyces sp. NPDC051976 TaxID=3154947 RepID=UPI0034444F17
MSRAQLPPVLLLHALPLDARMWRGPHQALLAAGHRVIAHNQRGFGGVDLGVAPPDLAVVADDVAAELDRQAVESAVVAGCSMGVYVALALLRRHPARVRALALLSGRATADSPQAAAERRAFADVILDPVAGPSLVERSSALLLGATTRAGTPSLGEEVLSWARGADPTAVAWAQRAIAARPDSQEALRESPGAGPRGGGRGGHPRPAGGTAAHGRRHPGRPLRHGAPRRPPPAPGGATVSGLLTDFASSVRAPLVS